MMERVHLPEHARRIVEARAQAAGFADLKRAAAAMSDAYRGRQPVRVSTPEQVAAYLATRMPATYAAARRVLAEVRERLGADAITTILDVGAGPGGASLAARECFPAAAVTLIEREPALAAAAREFLPDAQIELQRVEQIAELPPADLVIAAYALGEFPRFPVERLWSAARIALAVIEPGSPDGFGLIRRLRGELLAAGAHMLAPCPAESECPLAPPDWCHFAARVERSSLHRRLKDAALGHEDEKFSYVVLARRPVPPAEARVIRRPDRGPGLITLETCTVQGLKTRRVTKRDRAAFRAARQAAWGDAL